MSDILVYNAISQANKQLRMDLGEPRNLQDGLCNPNFYTLYTSIPSLSTANALCVYDNTTYFRDGKCCQWTVPAGATKVRFELWGAGAGTGIGSCCGGAPFGASGAYASVIINAVEGCQYTLCAGAASSTQLYCTQSSDVSGCASYVTGYGLTGFCADGGCSSITRMIEMVSGTTSPSKYSSDGASGTVSIYSQRYLCTPGATGSSILRSYDAAKTGHGSATSGTVYSIPSMYSADTYDSSFYGVACDQPTLLPNGTISPICCVSYSSGTCCGAAYAGACVGARCAPGKGGAFTHIMGGNVGGYGDWGRTGMVKVSWC